jgi:hypothetical protein
LLAAELRPIMGEGLIGLLDTAKSGITSFIEYLIGFVIDLLKNIFKSVAGEIFTPSNYFPSLSFFKSS